MFDPGPEPKPIADELLELADRWPFYPSIAASRDSDREKAQERTCTRCAECDGEITPPADREDVVGHLMQSHGYRSNGVQYDNRNNVIGRAAHAYR